MSTTQTLRLVSRELASMTKNPPEGVRVRFDEDDLLGSVEGLIEGPAGTPYEGGFFRVRFDFVDVDFPNMPPKCTMLTKIFHPNISKAGEICVDTLKKGWKREYGIAHVLVTVKCLFIVPNPESALDEEAGKLLLEEYDSYFKMAQLMTGIHATPKRPPPEFTNATASTSRPTPTPTSNHHKLGTSSSSGSFSPTSKGRTHSPSPSIGAGSTFSSGRPPQPLQTHLQQGQVAALLPAAEEKGLGISNALPTTTANANGAISGSKVAKTTSGKTTGGAGSSVASKAKRGLKRL